MAIWPLVEWTTRVGIGGQLRSRRGTIFEGTGKRKSFVCVNLFLISHELDYPR